jgi:D-amino-acid dehydrogenase
MTIAEAPVVVVGAGIVGVCCAAYLVRGGVPVILVDRRGPGEMTSFGNAGGIQNLATMPIGMPGMIWDVPKWLRDPHGPLHIRKRYLPRALPWLSRFMAETRLARVRHNAAALQALNRHCVDSLMPLVRWAGVEDLIRVPGQLYLYMKRESYESDRLVNELRAASGESYDVLGKDEIRDLEPDLAPIFEVALRAHGNGHCRNPHRLATALAERVAREGGQILRAEVNGLDVTDGKIAAVRTDRGTIIPRAVVIASGMWSRTLAKLLGHRVPLESQRGYHVTIADPGTAPRNMLMVLDKKIAITPMETGVRIAGTVELAGLEALPNYERAEIFLDIGKTIMPNLRTERHSEWMGHRPCLPDSLPVIGRAPNLANAFFAFGHGHLGLLGAAPTGRVIAQIVTGQAPMIDLAPYRIDRF